MKIFLLIIFSTITIGFCTAQKKLGFSLAQGRNQTHIPFELHNNLVVVPIVLNNMLPLKFVVDTGVQTGIITQKEFTDILQLAYTRKFVLSAPGNEKTVEAYVTNNVTFDLPGIHGIGHALLVLAKDYLELRNYLGTDVHGILGYELFSRFVVKIDYTKKEMVVYDASKFKPRRRYVEIPMSIESTKPFIMAKVVLEDGTTMNAKLLIDTGASHGILLEPNSNEAIEAPSKTVSSNIGRGIGGEITGKIGRIKSISLGDYVIDDPIVSFPDPNSYMDSLKLGLTSRNGTLGGEVLSRFIVVFDFPNEKLYLKKNAQFKKKFYYNLSGITVKAKGSSLQTFEITEVKSESNAEKAGVIVGDIIHSINGVLAENLTLSTVNGFLNSKPGKRIRLEIKRDSKKLLMKFYLHEMI